MIDKRHRQQGAPDSSARRATPLALKLQNKIADSGPISVAAYVEACLKDPEYGYYVHSPAIGAAGDFVTAPEISQVFGELIGAWCTVVWRQMGEPEQVNLLEFGPGRGTLMSDILRTASKFPRFQAALSVHLLETNHVLREQQEQALRTQVGRLAHYDSAAGLCQSAVQATNAPWIVIGNEFLDALGARQLVAQGGVWRERTVQCVQGRLEFGLGEPAEPCDVGWLDARTAPDGAIFETIPAIDSSLVSLLQAFMRQAEVAVLFIDYGYEQTKLGETLQAVRRHAYEHPLTSPGEADLTAHVNFAAVAQAFHTAGLMPHDLLTQAEFLGRLGIVERTSQLMSANPVRASALETATLRLMAPNGMGGRFKAIAAASCGCLCPLPGFACN